MNNDQIFTTEQVRGFNNSIRPWILANGTAKMLADFDANMAHWLNKYPPPPPPTFWDKLQDSLHTLWVFAVFVFATIGLLYVGSLLGQWLSK